MGKQLNPDALEIIRNLRVVRTYGQFPKGKNYLYSQYKNLGLVKMSDLKKTDAFGYKIKGAGYLTPKSHAKLTKKGYKILKELQSSVV